MADEPNPSEDGKVSILVVELDPYMRELEAHFLREAGYSVEFVQDGTEAFEQILRTGPEIVITGILMPGMDGLTLCRRLKADSRTRKTSVLVFSILASPDRAREAGADAFLMKPLSEQALIEAVQRLLEARRTNQEAST